METVILSIHGTSGKSALLHIEINPKYNNENPNKLKINTTKQTPHMHIYLLLINCSVWSELKSITNS